MTKPVTEQIKEEEGFTLIELMVVVLIIGILMAIAIPTFLSAKNSANARAAQSNLRNALSAQSAQYANNQSYNQSLSAMQSAEPGLTWASWPASGAWTTNTVYFKATAANSTPNQVLIGALGADKNCYYVLNQDGQVFYTTNAASSSTCSLTISSASWTQSWGGSATSSTPNSSATLSTTA